MLQNKTRFKVFSPAKLRLVKFSIVLLILSFLLLNYSYSNIDCVIQDISCIKDLTFLYEVATIEDIYLAYEQLKVDENSLYSCIGIAGAQTAQDIAGLVIFPMANIGSCFANFSKEFWNLNPDFIFHLYLIWALALTIVSIPRFD